MKIYIASSWKNQHGVEMLTYFLREIGHEVISWVENNYGEFHNHVTKKLDFETWVNSPESDQTFVFDVNGASYCDLFIYYCPCGVDASVELGLAYQNGIPCVGLASKQMDIGLMRKCVSKWFSRYSDLMIYIQTL